jgi:hypothetical protein
MLRRAGRVLGGPDPYSPPWRLPLLPHFRLLATGTSSSRSCSELRGLAIGCADLAGGS